MNTDDVVVGVCGDNSKTDVFLGTSEGVVLAAVRGAAATPNELGPERCAAALHDAVRLAWADAGFAGSEPRMEAMSVFMAGLDRPQDDAHLLEALQRRRMAARVQVANDVFALLWASTGSPNGIAVFFGGGINCVGQSASGQVVRFAALGDITGDWGSGPDLGLAALGAATRAEDGRGPATWLSRAIADYFRLTSATEVAMALSDGRVSRSRLVEVAPLVVTAGAIGDEAAEVLLDRLAGEVVCFAGAAIHRLGLDGAEVDVVLGGSLLSSSGSAVTRRIEDRLREAAPRARPVVCTTEPIVGAAVAALRLVAAGDRAVNTARAALVPSRIRVVGGRSFLNIPGH